MPAEVKCGECKGLVPSFAAGADGHGLGGVPHGGRRRHELTRFQEVEQSRFTWEGNTLIAILYNIDGWIFLPTFLPALSRPKKRSLPVRLDRPSMPMIESRIQVRNDNNIF